MARGKAGYRASEGGDKKGSRELLWNWWMKWAGALQTALDSLPCLAITAILIEASLPRSRSLNGSCITWPLSAHQVTHQEPAILQIAGQNFEANDVSGDPYISLN